MLEYTIKICRFSHGPQTGNAKCHRYICNLQLVESCLCLLGVWGAPCRFLACFVMHGNQALRAVSRLCGLSASYWLHSMNGASGTRPLLVKTKPVYAPSIVSGCGVVSNNARTGGYAAQRERQSTYMVAIGPE